MMNYIEIANFAAFATLFTMAEAGLYFWVTNFDKAHEKAEEMIEKRSDGNALRKYLKVAPWKEKLDYTFYPVHYVENKKL